MKRFLLSAAVAALFIPAIAVADTNKNVMDSHPNETVLGNTTQTTISGETLTNADIKSIQEALKKEGAFDGTPDGVWSSQTASAIKDFQTENKLSASGKLDTNTLNELGVRLTDTSQLRAKSPANEAPNARQMQGTQSEVGQDGAPATGTSNGY